MRLSSAGLGWRVFAPCLCCGSLDRVIELLLQELLRIEQVTESELQLARLSALALGAEQAPFQQVVFVDELPMVSCKAWI